jgi:hypothetical protein
MEYIWKNITHSYEDLTPNEDYIVLFCYSDGWEVNYHMEIEFKNVIFQYQDGAPTTITSSSHTSLVSFNIGPVLMGIIIAGGIFFIRIQNKKSKV